MSNINSLLERLDFSWMLETKKIPAARCVILIIWLKDQQFTAPFFKITFGHFIRQWKEAGNVRRGNKMQ